MTNLIPEKRMDRNGKLVTKHVISTPRVTLPHDALPSPSLGGAAIRHAASKAFKPRPKQLRPYRHAFSLSKFASDFPLTDPDTRKRYADFSMHTEFTANDVEFYDVLSATTSTGNALELLQAGVRTAEQARTYLAMRGAENLVADRSDLAHEALKRGIRPHDFATGYEQLTPEERSSEHFMDAVEFMSTSLNEGANRYVKNEIINGNVSYRDIKFIGISKLKLRSRAQDLIGPLSSLNRGEADYTIDDIKELVERHAPEKDVSFHVLSDILFFAGPDAIRNVQSLSNLDAQHYYYVRSEKSSAHDGEDTPHVYRLLTYAAQTKEKITTGLFGRSVFFTDEFYEAGIPADVAASVIDAGGGINEAIAIHNEGIERSIAGGWL